MDPFFLDNDERSATYLDYGAGLWIAEEKGEDKTLFSYRIYIDPGGALPDFLVDMINKTSVTNIFLDVSVSQSLSSSTPYTYVKKVEDTTRELRGGEFIGNSFAPSSEGSFVYNP